MFGVKKRGREPRQLIFGCSLQRGKCCGCIVLKWEEAFV
jgi:hypothetical protein